MIVKRETIAEFHKDLLPLFNGDWDETVVYSEDAKLNLDVPFYERLESAGRLFMMVAREDNIPAGYLGFIVSQSKHTQELVAQCLGLYVAKEYRGKGLWKTLKEQAMKELKAVGCGHMRIHTSPKNDVSALFERGGFVKEETIYGLRF
jgi:GNAT superfamily N-acetyltransferase